MKITRSLCFIFLFFSGMAGSLFAQYEVTFSIDLRQLTAAGTPLQTVGVRGSVPPLSWEQTYPVEDRDGDGIYQATAILNDPGRQPFLEYKYVYGEEPVWELDDRGATGSCCSAATGSSCRWKPGISPVRWRA